MSSVKKLTIITPKTPEMYVLLCCAGKPVPDNFTAAPHLLRHSPSDVILAIPPDPASNEAVSVSLLVLVGSGGHGSAMPNPLTANGVLTELIRQVARKSTTLQGEKSGGLVTLP